MIQAEETFQPIDIARLTESERKQRKSTPITISEDSDDDRKNFKRLHRTFSLPTYLHPPQSIMKKRTVDESLHSTYGGSEDGTMCGRGKDRPSLRFDKINIRVYSRTVGDNPSCSSGPPISISWDYNIVGDIDIDEYESTRPPRRHNKEMAMPRRMREEMLRTEWNASRKEITEAIRQNVKIKNQRRTTINNLGKAEKYEEMMESASRKLNRFVRFQKSVKKQVKEMQDEIEATERRRSKMIYLDHMMGIDGDDSVTTMSQSAHTDRMMTLKSLDGEEPVPSEQLSLEMAPDTSVYSH